jgi:tellurite methyltransferase
VDPDCNILEDKNLTAEYWSNYYSLNEPKSASAFAEWCLTNHFDQKNKIIELGCGDGRDTFYFIKNGIDIHAIDRCEIAIGKNTNRYIELYKDRRKRFFNFDFENIKDYEEIESIKIIEKNTIYSRFVLHAISEKIEDEIINFCENKFLPGTRMYHEFRTDKDTLMKKGKKVSANERITDHYRRFINTDSFRKKMKSKNWKELYFNESSGLANYGKEDPVVARIILEKIL